MPGGDIYYYQRPVNIAQSRDSMLVLMLRHVRYAPRDADRSVSACQIHARLQCASARPPVCVSRVLYELVSYRKFGKSFGGATLQGGAPLRHVTGAARVAAEGAASLDFRRGGGGAGPMSATETKSAQLAHELAPYRATRAECSTRSCPRYW